VTAQPATDVPVVPARQANRLVELNDCLSLDDLPGRDLEPRELSELAASIAAQPHLWEDKVAYSDEERVFASLHRDANIDVWLICGPRSTTPAGTTTTSPPAPSRSPAASWSSTT
jgi:hypothetical protein